MKRQCLLLLLWALCLTGSRADTLAEVDSLLQVYGQSKGQARAAVGRELMAIYADFPVFFHDAPAIADGMDARERDLIVWFSTERFYTTCAYYTEALKYGERAMALAGDVAVPATPPDEPTPGQDMLATLLCDRSYCLFKTSDYTGAVETATRAKELCQQTANTMQLARAYLYLSLVNHSLRNYDEAKTLVVKAIDTNAQLGQNSQTHNLLGVACELFCSANEVDQAIVYGEQAVEAARTSGEQAAVANHLTQLSYAYDRKGNYLRGLETADEAIAIVKQLEPLDRNQLALTLEYKSWNLIDLKRNREAVEALREAIALEEAVGNASAVRYDYRTLSEALEPIDAKEALLAMKRCLTMTDSLHTEEMKALTMKANAEVHNDELLEENAESRRLNRIITISFVVVVLLMAAVVASLWFAFRQKKRSNKALQRLTEVREAFFTNVTHEFRTPLTVILGVAKELQAEGNALGVPVERQGQQLLRLVNQMLDISKVKSALGEQPLTTGDLASYVAMLVERHQEMARQKDITVSYDTDEGGIETGYVADYVEKLVGNLLSNAIKYTPKGGQVTVGLHRQGRELLLTVSDNGQGIAAEHLPHIFEPFYKADTSDGSGVGLALVRQIVDALNGSIDVESKVGEGTTFRVKALETQQTLQTHPRPLPIGRGVVSSSADKVDSLSDNPFIDKTIYSPPSEGGAGGGSAGSAAFPLLLIVEDNPDVASLIGRQLQGRYSISYASDGSEGLAKARELMPDLIITDVMMPGTDGLELCRMLRADDVVNHIPVIVVTAKVSEDDRIEGLRAGADAYLNKPFNADELKVRVEKLLEQRELLRAKFGQLDSPADAGVDELADDNSFAPNSASFVENVRQCVIALMATRECDVEHVASRLNLSTFQLRSKLTAITGVTPKRYIVRLQLEEARKMLSDHPERKVLDVAERCGFYDQSHFTRQFREAFGITPGDYLKQQMN